MLRITWLLVCLSCIPVALHAQTIEWTDIDLPPLHAITDGPYKGQGITDQLTGLLAKHLPQFEHKRSIIPSKRVLYMLEKGQSICNPSTKKTPAREAIMYFSIPSVFIRGVGITTTVKTTGELPGTRSLQAILEARYKVGIEAGRSYGQRVDAVLARFAHSPQLIDRATENAYEGSVRMLLKDHVHYVLGYPMEFSYTLTRLDAPQKLRFYPLEEEDAFTMSHVACSKTPEGLAIIKLINERLRELRPTPPYRAILERWQPANIIEEYRAAYDQQFLTVLE